MEFSRVARLACLLVLASRCVVSFGLQGKDPLSVGLVLAGWFFVLASSMETIIMRLLSLSRARTA